MKMPWTLTPILLRTIFAFILYRTLLVVARVLLNADADAIVMMAAAVAVKSTFIMECIVPAIYTKYNQCLFFFLSHSMAHRVSVYLVCVLYYVICSRLWDKNRIKETLNV